MSWLKRLVEILENREMSLSGFLCTFLGVLFFRNFLETFSDSDNLWTSISPTGYLVHYPMFYLCFFLGLMISLRLLTGEKILKITRLTIFFVPVILLAPTLDLMLSRGKGFNMGYLFEDLPGLVRRYMMFTGGCSPQGATPGIRIELIVIFSLLGTYLYLKTRNLLRILAGLVVLYSMGFAIGALPSITTIVWTADLHAGAEAQVFAGSVVLHHFYSFNHKIALTFLPILICMLGLWYLLYDGRKFAALLRNLRVERALHYVCMLGIGMVIGYARHRAGEQLDSPFLPLILVVAAVSVVLAWWYAVGENDLHDIEADRISNPRRPLPSGIIGAQELRCINFVLLILSLVAACLVRYAFMLPILVSIGLSYAFSAPPFRLKRIPFLATFISALCSALVCLAGFVLFSDDYSFYGFPPRVLMTILVAFPLAFMVKDIKDRAGDRMDGVVTLPVLLGEKRGKQVVGALASAAYVSVPLILNLTVLLPFSAVFGGLTFFLVNRKRFKEGPVFLCYFLFIAVLGYFLYHEFRIG